jgi:hypothetical protein
LWIPCKRWAAGKEDRRVVIKDNFNARKQDAKQELEANRKKEVQKKERAANLWH